MAGAMSDSGAAKTFAGDTVKETCDSEGNYSVPGIVCHLNGQRGAGFTCSR